MLRDPSLLDATLGRERRDLVRRFVASLRGLMGPRLASVTLFGSFARGDAHDESDIDMLVLLRDEPTREDRRAVAEMATAIETTTDAFVVFSPILLPQAAFDRLRARERRFALEVEREGFRL